MTKEKKTEVATVVKSGLAKVQETYVQSLIATTREMNLQLSEYQKTCVFHAISTMDTLLKKDGLTFHEIDQNNIANILQTIAMLKINLAATPREGYIIIRNVEVGPYKNKQWIKQFEFSLEGDGNDKLLREYGVGIKKVHGYWAVREEDDFTYPTFEGLDVIPPKWSPRYKGNYVRVVYPIEFEDGTVEYHIAEREDVVRNLQAHIANNIKMIKDEKIMTYQAKEDLLSKISGMSLDEILSDREICKLGKVSPSWKDPHSREAMILRKLRNNAIKKIPKDFNNSFVKAEYEKTFEDYDQYRDNRINVEEALTIEVEEKAMSEPLIEEVVVEVEEVEEVAEASEVVVPF